MTPDKLPGYLRELVALMAVHQVDGLMYGHFGDGCVHVRIGFPLRDRPAVLREFTQDAARLAAGWRVRVRRARRGAPAANCSPRCTPPKRSGCSAR